MGCAKTSPTSAKKSTNSETQKKHKKHCISALLDHKTFAIENNGDIHEEYKFEKLLGKGTYGEVVQAVHRKTGAARAIKVLDKYLFDEQVETKHIEEEYKILKSIEHPNVIKVYEIFEDNKYLYIVMELLNGGELFSMLIKEEKLIPEQVAAIIRQTLQGIAYLHSKKICHRDINPRNILYESKDTKISIKICDFGTAKLFKKDKYFRDIMGTPYFMAPEILKGSPYNYKVDIWSMGIMAYLLIMGRFPFSKNQGKFEKNLNYEDEIINFNFNESLFASNPKISKEFIDFISHCLATDPNSRWESAQLLEHPWIVSGIEKEFVSDDFINTVATNIKNYNKLAFLERAVFTFLTVNYNAEEENDLKELFAKLDKSHNGKLEKNEFEEIYKHHCLKVVYTKQEIDEIFDEIDSDHSGKIGYNEFIQATISKAKFITDKKLTAAFAFFDANNDGLISKEDLKEVLHHGGVHLGIATIQFIIEEIDKNKDSKISFEEFKCVMMRLLNSNK